MTYNGRESAAILEWPSEETDVARDVLAVGPTVFCNADLGGFMHIAFPLQANFG